MRLFLANRNFTFLWCAGLLSVMGNWALGVALPVYIYDRTDSTLATGLMFATSTLPRLALNALAGIYVDRWDKRKTLVVINVLLSLALIPLLFNSQVESLWLVYLVAFLVASLSRFVEPAENALLPTLVNEEKLVSANALNALNNNLARLLGPAIGGLLMSALGLQTVVIFDALTFLLASLLIAFISPPEAGTLNQADKAGSRPQEKAGVWQEWLAGLRIIRQQGVVLIIFIFMAITSIGEGVMATLFIPFVKDVLKGSSLEVGWLYSAQAFGGIFGGVLISTLAKHIHAARLVAWGAIMVGITDAIIFNYPLFLPGILLAVVLFVLAGLPVSALYAGLMTLFQTNVNNAFQGRVYSSIDTTMALFSLIGIGLSGALADKFGIIPIINIQAMAYCMGGTVVLFSLVVHLSKPHSEEYATGNE